MRFQSKKTILLIFIIATAKIYSQSLAIADSLFAVGNYSQAILEYQDLQQPAFFKIAKSQEALGQDKTALESYQKLLSEQPKNLLGTLSYSKLLVKTKQYKTADSLLLSVLKNDSKNPNVAYQLGLSKQKQGDSTAITFFQLASMADAQFLNAKYQVAKHYVVKRKFEQAQPIINNVLEADASNIRFLNLRALSQFYQKDYWKAAKTYNLLLELGDATQQLYENLSTIYYKNLSFNKAIPLYKTLIDTYDDQNPKWHYELGRCYFIEGDMEKAQEHFRISLLILDKPLDTQYLSFAMTFMEQKNYKKAIEFLKVSIEENPENIMANYQFAIVADNYYEDKKSVLNIYQRFLDKFGSEGNISNLIKQRMGDIREELHFDKTDDKK